MVIYQYEYLINLNKIVEERTWREKILPVSRKIEPWNRTISSLQMTIFLYLYYICIYCIGIVASKKRYDAPQVAWVLFSFITAYHRYGCNHNADDNDNDNDDDNDNGCNLLSLRITDMTGSQYKGKYLSGCVPENLTLCRTHSIFLKNTMWKLWAELSNDV